MLDQLERLQYPKPLLTIAIPTFNRAQFLTELLSSIFDQLRNEPRVELLISDNASADETPRVVQDFVERGLRIGYLRNAVNVGAEPNFVQCFEKARGKYVWIVGDDDVLARGAISAILTYLEAESYDLVYVNSYSFSGSKTPRAASLHVKALRITDASEFARRVNVFFTFISSNIVNREGLGMSSHEQLSSLVGTSLVHLTWTYSALARYKVGLFIPEQLVGMRINNTGGYKLLEVFGSTLKSITQQRLHSEGVKRAIINGVAQRFWPGILLMYRSSAERFESEASPQEVLTPVFGDNFRYWSFAYPIIVLPLALARCWFLVVRVINRLDKAVGFVLLR